MSHTPAPTQAPAILVVDDNPRTLEETCRALRDAGFRVVEQLGPFGATALVAREKIELAVLDVMMPGLNGNHLGKLIRDNSMVPVVYLSAIPEEELRAIAASTFGATYVLRSEGASYLIREINRRLGLSFPSQSPTGVWQ